MLFGRFLAAEDEKREITSKLSQTQKAVNTVKLSVTNNFTPSKELNVSQKSGRTRLRTLTKYPQKRLIEIAKHFMIQPNGTYVQVSKAIEKYV